ncbi:MAG TPA: tetratricopeptide repeat protein [Rhodocyclaceae bacterium]|nr:tetratricopeptide repeat protein [Rhodocyclaceae bacterium]
MDALKRAELAKQRGQAEALAEAEAPTQPPEMPPASAAALPELSKLEDLDAEFIAHARQPAPARQMAQPSIGAAPANASPSPRGGVPPASPTLSAGPRAGTAADRQAIRNAFAVKQPGGNKTLMLAAAAVALLAIAGAAIYLWLELKPTQGTALAPTASIPNTVRQPPSIQGDTASAPRAAPAPAVAAAPAALPARIIPPQASLEPARTPAGRAAPFYAAGDTQVRVTSTHAGVDPTSAEGYQALQSGNLPAARAAYERLLRADPHNAEALHGLAAVALREGKAADAEAAYLKIIESDPGDAAAQAGLVALNPQVDPVASENRMKSLLATQGDIPAVNFALGNLYARQNRWNDAQQAYFRAVAADEANADYLFNLAVSLDQLHQPKLAAQYYGRALAAAEKISPAFDRAQAARRLRELQP